MCVSHERILMRSDRTASLFQTRLGIGIAFQFFVRKANPQRTALGSHPKAGPKSSRSGASPSQTSRLAGRCPATRVTARKTVYTKLPFRHLPNIDTMCMELYGIVLTCTCLILKKMERKIRLYQAQNQICNPPKL